MIARRDFVSALSCLVAALSSRPTLAAALDVVHKVDPFAQTRIMDCWLAAAVPMLRWKNKIPVSELDVAKMAGPNFVAAFRADTGLNGGEFADFAAKLGLRTEAPQNFTAGGYANLLRAHGPLWVGSRLDVGTDKSRRHVRVLHGITGDGTPGGTTAWVLDPDGGRAYQESVAKFAAELEQIAREEIGAGHALFPQVIHFP